jgi:hypothetical protein
MKEKFFGLVIRFRIPIMILFLAGAVAGAYCKQLVAVDYDINDYLPEGTPSTIALDVMDAEFDGAIPNARIAVKNVTYAQALSYKKQLLGIPGVESVTWLDDSNVLDLPFRLLDEETVNSYYKDETALYTVTIDEASIHETIPAIRELIGEDNAMTGGAVSLSIAAASTVSEVRIVTVIAILVALFMLVITTTSWLEPLLVLVGIGVAVLINAGSNLIFGEVSFVTNAAGNILQLAVSLDYSVFLIHRFEECRKTGLQPEEAMKQALCKSSSSILSSGLTTVIGFLALLLMRFGIGPDLGRALAKGIGISLLTAFLFMPGLILTFYQWMERTSHRQLLPSFHGFGKLVGKITIPCAFLFGLLIIPSFYFSNHNAYYYGSAHIFDVGTEYGDDTAFITEKFGVRDTYVLMVPNDSDKAERKLCEELKTSEQILSITSLAEILGPALPVDVLPDSIASLLHSEHYNRILLSVNAESEGDETFSLVTYVRDTAAKYYGDSYYLAGRGVSTYDLMDTITSDMVKVNLAAIGAVFLILLLTMRSLKLPVVLVLTIETAIWINLTIPYLQGKPLFYIAYLIISSVQLGATVDYAILFTDRYGECRETRSPKESVVEAIAQTTSSMLTSALVLTAVGFLLGIVSTHGLLSQLGYLLGKGTLCSLAAVLFVLPGLLCLTDRRKG